MDTPDDEIRERTCGPTVRRSAGARLRQALVLIGVGCGAILLPASELVLGIAGHHVVTWETMWRREAVTGEAGVPRTRGDSRPAPVALRVVGGPQ